MATSEITGPSTVHKYSLPIRFERLDMSADANVEPRNIVVPAPESWWCSYR